MNCSYLTEKNKQIWCKDCNNQIHYIAQQNVREITTVYTYLWCADLKNVFLFLLATLVFQYIVIMSVVLIEGANN